MQPKSLLVLLTGVIAAVAAAPTPEPELQDRDEVEARSKSWTAEGGCKTDWADRCNAQCIGEGVKKHGCTKSDVRSVGVGEQVSAGEDTSNNPGTLQFVGLSGDQDPFILQYCPTKRVQGIDGIQWTCQRLGNDPRFPASFTAVPDQHLDARPSYYPVARIQEIASPHHDQLVNAFFEVVHPALPILDPQSFSCSTACSTLLASVFALAHLYCHEAQAINPWLFMDFNSQALPIEARNAKLETVEAALLHAQRHTYVFRAPTMPGMWAEVGTIVGMSQDVGLNIDASTWNIPEGQKKRRKRLWWAVYMQDKWAALTLGRPSYIHDDQNDVGDLEVTDMIPDQRAVADVRGLPARVFVAAARLTVILSDILSQLYTVKGVKRLHSLEIQECHDIASAFLARLDRWREEHLAPLLEHHIMHDPTGNLQLAYYTIEITLYRAILRTAAGRQYRQRSAAVVCNVIDWLKNLQVNRLSGFWWLTSKINFAIAGGFMVGMFLSATEDDEVNYWMKQITTYRDLLKAHSVNFNITKLASIRMDLLLQRDSSNNASTGEDEAEADLNTRRAAAQLQELEDQEQRVARGGSVGEINDSSLSEALRDDFPVDPAVAFGNTYGLEWDAGLDQLLSSFDYI
ncbi:fungal-specific transcription factor domain-containing protein [Phialemonium atrogriseum]|uniref:Fungal-specific transcription factor domain-containing protein n=1 Tax=Phialemonium atrogriseum TaxID=1093897 RepID=A0AAJ0BS37_9PEZI|nr:fungal-specific transcription factor domain-containing protein [Phialemonium atrogriseum]KAK1763240.1 fungal-specific transcription factor domain-containing protein [Phialemonium atrogriseum]